MSVSISIDRALCARAIARGNPDLWLSRDRQDQIAAQRICKECPLRLDCVLLAQEVNATCGVWGGVIVGRYVEDAEGHRNSHPKKAPAKTAPPDPPGPSETDRNRQYARVQRGRKGAAARLGRLGRQSG